MMNNSPHHECQESPNNASEHVVGEERIILINAMSTQEEGKADRNERNHEGNNNHWVNSIVLS